jgi:endonuclease YncB( thermonuclease family)
MLSFKNWCCKEKKQGKIQRGVQALKKRFSSSKKIEPITVYPSSMGINISTYVDPSYDEGIPDDMIDVSVYDIDKVKPFTMENLQLRCYVSQVYDADTCTLIVPFYGKPFVVKCRLNGIDSAEMRSKDPREKEYATEARNYLRSIILNTMVWVDCNKMDKYGRLLGSIYINKNDMILKKRGISQHLMDKKYAYPYQGGKKLSFTEWFDLIDQLP